MLSIHGAARYPQNLRSGWGKGRKQEQGRPIFARVGLVVGLAAILLAACGVAAGGDSANPTTDVAVERSGAADLCDALRNILEDQVQALGKEASLSPVTVKNYGYPSAPDCVVSVPNDINSVHYSIQIASEGEVIDASLCLPPTADLPRVSQIESELDKIERNTGGPLQYCSSSGRTYSTNPVIPSNRKWVAWTYASGDSQSETRALVSIEILVRWLAVTGYNGADG